MTARSTGARNAPRSGLDATRLEDWERPYPSKVTFRSDGRAGPSNDLDALWHRWSTERDVEARDALVARYFPLVGHVARSLATKLSARADVDDLIGFGAEGLL